MREMEEKEAQYRENWLARKSHATQAKAVLVGTKALKRSYRQREGECTSAMLHLNLSKLVKYLGKKKLKLRPGPPTLQKQMSETNGLERHE